MKNLILFVHPSGDFLPEHKTSVKIAIDNSLDLGWKVSDIILATNFPYEYNGVKSLKVSSDNYDANISPCPIINVIVELFERGLIEKNEIYWYHDEDAFQLHKITESELNLGELDMGLVEWPTGQHISASSIFFKSSAKDIFGWIKEIMYKYRIEEESAMTALYTNNILWATASWWDAQQKFVPLNFKGSENVEKRVKKLNITYDFEIGYLNLYYRMSTKPIKVAHFHFMKDRLLDSAMYGKNSRNKPLMPQRLIKIFHKHGVKGVNPKIMKNLMICLNSEKRFSDESESLVKRQINNSFKLGWKQEDIILLTNFSWKYRGVKTTVIDYLSSNVNTKAIKTNAIFALLRQGVVKEAELWWCHDLDVLELRKIKSPEINLEDTFAGFMLDGSGKFDTGSFFFRKESDKIFEWIRNRTCRLNTDEATAFMSLVAENYHHINSKYKRLPKKLTKIFSKQ